MFLFIIKWLKLFCFYNSHKVLCGGCTYSSVWWLYIQFCVVAVHTVLCGGCTYSSVWWLYIQFCVVAVHTVLCGGCIYSSVWWLYIHSVYTICMLILSSYWARYVPNITWQYVQTATNAQIGKTVDTTYQNLNKSFQYTPASRTTASTCRLYIRATATTQNFV